MLEMSTKSKKATQAPGEVVLSKKTEHFSKTEYELLVHKFNILLVEQESRGKAAPGLDRVMFRGILLNIFGMTNAMMMDGVFRTFDKDGDGLISLEEWIRGLSVFLRGTLEEKMRHCFRVYDLNDDKYIAKDEIFHIMKQSFIKQPNEEDPEEIIKEVVEITMKKMDHDHDGLLSYDDFKKSIQEDNLFLEAFGNCLPDHMSIERFEQMVFQEQQEQ